MASSRLGEWKQVQDARFDSHLTGAKKESFYWRTKKIAHNKGFPERLGSNGGVTTCRKTVLLTLLFCRG